MKDLLISVHMPKTAGTSFSRVLQDCYGEALHLDYQDQPLNRRPLVRKLAASSHCMKNRWSSTLPDTVRCVHGHFLPLKYRGLKDRSCSYVVWLREPIARLASHYRYWQQSYDPATAGPLHRRVVEQAWSFEAFCFSHAMRNTYNQFLWGFAPSSFDFIGLTEFFDEDIAAFLSRYAPALRDSQVGVDANEPPRANVTEVGSETSSDQIDSWLRDPDFHKRIEEFHALDVRLYREQLERRKQRTAA